MYSVPVASFPDPTHLSVVISMENHFSVLQATESWAGPGNEATLSVEADYNQPSNNEGAVVNHPNVGIDLALFPGLPTVQFLIPTVCNKVGVYHGSEVHV